MGFIDSVLGPRSKYDPTIPYTYEARVPIPGLAEEFESYFGDTICALTGALAAARIEPDGCQVFEVYRHLETEIPTLHLTDETGQWLAKPDLCRALERHYEGHIRGTACSFQDRDKQGAGPY